MITQKHVSDTYGPLPPGGRLPGPAARLVGSSLTTAMPELSSAAGRVVAQHLHRASAENPHKGTADSIECIAEDLGCELHPYRGPEGMERAVHENHPLPAFLNEAKRLTYHENKKKDEEKDIRRAEKELVELAAAEGGFDFGSFARKARSSPFAKIAADIAMEKLAQSIGGAELAGAPVGGKNFIKDMFDTEGSAKRLFGGAESSAAKGRRYADEDLRNAMRAHKGKMTKKEQLQALHDLEKYSEKSRKKPASGGRRASSGVKKSSLYEAFRA